jgi:hypothetical protein
LSHPHFVRLGFVVSLVALSACGTTPSPMDDVAPDTPGPGVDVRGDIASTPDASVGPDASDAGGGDTTADADAPAVRPDVVLPDVVPDVRPDAVTGPDAGCVVVPNTASDVTLVQVPTAVPAATGGTIRDGVYYLTAVTNYSGPGGPSGPDPAVTQRSTLEIAGPVMRENITLTFTDEGIMSMGSYTVTYVTASTSMTRTAVCRSGLVRPVIRPMDSYSATTTEFSLQTSSTIVNTYTWQRP